MSLRRVVITGAGGVTAFGESWPAIKAGLLKGENAVKYMPEWERFKGLNARLGAPIPNFVLPEHYTRKKIRTMGRVSLLATRATELALEASGLNGSTEVTDGTTGIAFGSCSGSTAPLASIGEMLNTNDTCSITGTTYVQLMPHTAAVNAGLFFGVKGRMYTTSSACTSGSQAIGYSYEAIQHGYQDIMIAGGAEELCPSQVAVFDALFATSTRNDEPKLTPRPFDKNRDGLVIGEASSALILEEYEHAKARGAKIMAEVVGFATNCDAAHITQPNQLSIQICMEKALKQSGVPASEIGFISAHGTATTKGDVVESLATEKVFGNRVCISSLKSYFGHTLGACGAIEAWLSLEMAKEGWCNPTINLSEVDPNCGDLDYIRDEPRKLQTEYVMSNNFAFGGVNTSLIFRLL